MGTSTSNPWDSRFDRPDYFYGEAPNEFLRVQSHQLPAGGRVLSLGEGEGRNATYLAQQGFCVTAIDSSAVGLTKLARLAARRGVEVESRLEDLTQADLGENCWDGIVNIFCHMHAAERAPLYERIKRALVPGGVFLTEQFSTEQLQYKSGGPPIIEALMTLEELQRAFAGYELLYARQEIITLDEGPKHAGPASVVRFIARKPS
jgi:SAM-dependent methyltransferase